MPEDQLTRAERVRLEALAQAISSVMVLPVSGGFAGVLERAEKIERWLLVADLAGD